MSTIVVFNGAGGVGKTSVLTALSNRSHDLPFDFTVVPSVTRKSWGVATEKEAFELPQDEAEKVQDRVFKAFQAQALEYKKSHRRSSDVLVFDRGCHDYAAYQLMLFPHWSRARVDQLRLETINFMTQLYAGSKVVHMHFPTPSPWGESADDGVRYAPWAKNLVWDSVLLTIKETWHPPGMNPFGMKLEHSQLEHRVTEVINAIMWCRS